MRLIDFQRRFQAAILNPDTKETETSLGIKLPPGMATGRKLGIHLGHFWSRMRGFSRYRHPLLFRFVGEKEFNKIVRLYISAHPPKTVIATSVAENLARFLAQTEPWSQAPIYSHLAEFDFQRTVASNGAEEVTITAADFAAVDPKLLANVRLRLKKRSVVIKSHFNFNKMKFEDMTADLQPDREPTYLLIKMAGKKYQPERIDEKSYSAFKCLADGLTLTELQHRLASLDFSESERIAFLDKCLAGDLLVALEDEAEGALSAA